MGHLTRSGKASLGPCHLSRFLGDGGGSWHMERISFQALCIFQVFGSLLNSLMGPKEGECSSSNTGEE